MLTRKESKEANVCVLVDTKVRSTEEKRKRVAGKKREECQAFPTLLLSNASRLPDFSESKFASVIVDLNTLSHTYIAGVDVCRFAALTRVVHN